MFQRFVSWAWPATLLVMVIFALPAVLKTARKKKVKLRIY